jgi:hypothetical protein
LCRQFDLYCLVLSLSVCSLFCITFHVKEYVVSWPLCPWFSLQCVCPCSCVIPRRVC